MTQVGLRGDEYEAFDRPGRRSNRPRTKDRPDYADAETGMVITIDRGRYRLLISDREVTATKARQLGRKGVIVGDRVRVVGDTSGAEGTLARIVEVEERETVLRRTADDDDPYERPIVANADQLVIVTALADPPPRVGMIDRLLVAGYDAGHRTVALPHQGRSGRPGRTRSRNTSHSESPVQVTFPRRRSGPAAGPAATGPAASSWATRGLGSQLW